MHLLVEKPFINAFWPFVAFRFCFSALFLLGIDFISIFGLAHYWSSWNVLSSCLIKVWSTFLVQNSYISYKTDLSCLTIWNILWISLDVSAHSLCICTLHRISFLIVLYDFRTVCWRCFACINFLLVCRTFCSLWTICLVEFLCSLTICLAWTFCLLWTIWLYFEVSASDSFYEYLSYLLFLSVGPSASLNFLMNFLCLNYH